MLDAKTTALMQKPRCGNPDLGTLSSIRQPINLDKIDLFTANRGRSIKSKVPAAYVRQENKWHKTNLKWFIEQYPKQQDQITSHDQVRRIMKQAFNDWGKYSSLKFEMADKPNEADLKIQFHSKDHGDGYPFDGQGATLAHAFYPKQGDIHFDDDEKFTDSYKDTENQYTLRLVAAHEIGHALGLSHSFVEDSLMYPMYQQFDSNYEISDNDQRDIHALYGKANGDTSKESTKGTTSTKPTIPTSGRLPINNWCSANFQTGCEGPDGELYVFKDTKVWRYRARTKHTWDPQPQLISQRFPRIKDSTITACVKSNTGYVYLFHNYHVWKLKTHWSVDGPHSLHAKNYPQNPRVALFHNNSIYLLRDGLIYSLNEFDNDRELGIYSIHTILHSAPRETIHSGFTYNKRHYIFTRNHIYAYDSTYGNLLAGYPKPIANGWFACDRAAMRKTKIEKPSHRRNHHSQWKRSKHHFHRKHNRQEQSDLYHFYDRYYYRQ